MTVTILQGDVRDVLATLPADHFDCCVTSPPYWGLRDYGVYGQIGLEATLAKYLETMVEVCRGVRRVLKPEGTFWLNIGDSYANDGKWGGSTGGKHAAGNHGQTGIGRQKVTTGLKPKDLMMVPNRLAILLQEDSWYVRSEIIWHKPNPMPESVRDRPTSAHEKVWLLTKSERYFYDAEAVKEPVSVPGWNDGTRVYGGVNKAGANIAHGARTTGRTAGKGNAKTFRGGVYTQGAAFGNSAKMERDSHGNAPNTSGLRNARNVWTISPRPFKEAHFATFPPDLAERCIKAGCPVGGSVLDPFGGAGTTGLVAGRLGRHATLIELNPEYVAIARRRIEGDAPLLAQVV